MVEIVVPNVDTGEIQTFGIQVRNGFRIFFAVGWTITLVRLPTARTDSFVVPSTIPSALPGTSGVLANVKLPETGGAFQYWVPVLELHLGAVLHSREWTVAFHKRPKP